MNKSSREQSQKGAIAVVVAILLPTLVISLLAIVINVGQLYLERRELVRIADSIALYIAQECAKGAECPPSKQNIEQSVYATANSRDGKVTVDDICGYAPGSTSGTNLFDKYSSPGSPYFNGSCEPFQTNFNCTNKSVLGENNSPIYKFVRVRVSTLTDKNSNFLNLVIPPFLSGTLGEIKVGACSQAAWFPTTAAPVIYPLALTLCDYQQSGTKIFQGFLDSDPVYNNARPNDPAEICTYTPFGSTTQVTDSTTYFLKGAGIYNTINGELFSCPSPFAPRLLKVGDIMKLSTSVSNVTNDCANLLNQLQYPNNDAYSKFLDDYILSRKLYVPILGACKNQTNPSQCIEFEVVSFATIRIAGIKMGNQQTGTGPSGFTSWESLNGNSNWESSDCPGGAASYCIFGQFERTSPPTRPIPINTQSPAPIDAGSQQVFLLP